MEITVGQIISLVIIYMATLSFRKSIKLTKIWARAYEKFSVKQNVFLLLLYILTCTLMWLGTYVWLLTNHFNNL